MYLELLAIGVAIALSPIIISAFTRVAFGPGRAVAVPIFVAVVAGIAFAGALLVAVLLGEATGGLDDDTGATPVSVAAASVLALALLVLAWRSWGKRGASTAAGASSARKGEDAHADVDAPGGGGARAALGLGAAVMLANPKSLALITAAGDVIGVHATSAATAVSGALAFAVVAAGPIGAVAIYQAAGGAAAEARLATAERWLTRHDAVIKTSFLLIFAAYFAAQAISGLGVL